MGEKGTPDVPNATGDGTRSVPTILVPTTLVPAALAVLKVVWWAGVVVYVLVQAVRMGRMVRRVRGAKRVAALEETVAELARQMAMRPSAGAGGGGAGVAVCVDADVAGAAVAGGHAF